MKVLVIAIDGADPHYVRLGIEQGLLPTIAHLVEDGVWSSLRSTIPPISAPAWITFRAGKNPGRLGLAGFFVKKEGSYAVEVADFKVPHPAVWDILSHHGMRVGVVCVHLTYPPNPVNGIMVSPVYARSDHYYYPPAMQSEIEAQLGRLDYEAADKKILASNLREEHLRLEGNRLRLARAVLRSDSFDFFICGFNLDRVQHFTADEALILECYQHADHIIAELVDIARPDNVLIVSDHGGGPVRGRFFVNQWLTDQGFIRLKDTDSVPRGGSLVAREQIVRVLKDLGALPLARRLVPASARHLVPARNPSYVELLPQIDWSRTVAFCPFNGGIYLNLHGREPAGIVKPSQYDSTQSEIVSALRELKDPLTDMPLNIVVCKRQEVYEGPQASTLPDILFFSRDYSSSPAWSPYVLGPGGKPGDHRLEGVLVASGRDILSGVELNSPQLVDVAPTLLHLMGVPVADDMDGRVLGIVRAEEPPTYMHYAAPEVLRRVEDESRVMERLRALGYVD